MGPPFSTWERRPPCDNLAALGLPPTRVLSLWPAAFGLSGARLRGTAAYVADLGLDPAHVLARFPQLFSLGLGQATASRRQVDWVSNSQNGHKWWHSGCQNVCGLVVVLFLVGVN